MLHISALWYREHQIPRLEVCNGHAGSLFALLKGCSGDGCSERLVEEVLRQGRVVKPDLRVVTVTVCPTSTIAHTLRGSVDSPTSPCVGNPLVNNVLRYDGYRATAAWNLTEPAPFKLCGDSHTHKLLDLLHGETRWGAIRVGGA